MSRAVVVVVVLAGGACGSAPAPATTTATAAAAPAVPDPDDLCPALPEDLDGIADGDGCPETDHDQDRIPDVDDRCPNEREVYNGTDDTDGCPDRGCVLVRVHPACVFDRVSFDRGEPVPAAPYAPMLDGVARAMASTSADIEIVAIRGFRSSDEPAALSRQRAASIRDQLVRRGVDGARLEVADGGVGPQGEPAAQRRVELEIAKQRVAPGDADEIVCTPMGHLYVKLTEAEKQARCQPAPP